MLLPRKLNITRLGAVLILTLWCTVATAQSPNDEGALHNDLPEFLVTANRDYFKVKGPGKFSYEVAKDSTLRNANTVEALRNVPILDARADGQVSAMDGKALEFRLNGLHDPMLSNLSQALTAIPANVIKRIDFNVEFNSSGAQVIVVDIVTKAQLEGYRAQLTSGINDSRWKNGIWAMTKLRRLAIHGSYFNTWMWGHPSTSGSDEYRYDSPEFYRYVNESKDRGYRTDLHNFEVSASYDVADHAYISLYGGAMFKTDPRSSASSKTSIFDNRGNLAAAYGREDRTKMKDAEYQASVKFEKAYGGRHPGELNLGYEFYTRPYSSTSTSTYEITADESGTAPDFLGMTNSVLKLSKAYTTNTLAGEWQTLLSRHVILSAAGKFRTRWETYDNDLSERPLNRTDWSREMSSTSLQEQSGMLTPKLAYFTQVWEVRGGVLLQGYHHRIDATGFDRITNNRFMANPFVSVAIITPRNLTFELSYNQASRIPDITALDPYVVRTTAGEIQYGNPFLKPETTHTLKLEASKKTGKLFTGGSVNAGYTRDIILSYRFLDNGILNQTFGNVANLRNVGLSAYTSGRLHRNTYLRVNVSADWLQYRSGMLGLDNSGWQASITARLEQELPWDVTLDASGSYRSRSVLLQGKGAHNFSYTLGFYKQFFNRKLTVLVDADSFIPIWYKQTRDTFADQYSATSWSRTFHANFSLTLRYSFGHLKANVKQSSFSLDNDDVKKSY